MKAPTAMIVAKVAAGFMANWKTVVVVAEGWFVVRKLVNGLSVMSCNVAPETSPSRHFNLLMMPEVGGKVIARNDSLDMMEKW
ncbi:hypothetical protein DD238_008425 [Peronospora effusa]|uniref:Uncharacterized protein n=1 Tax=Peronospora effusa TaxID=542832 RepID=A0A3M6V8R5_9STRA|nr:hypothetical protein DD238_008425 [Peronospora effusa]